MSAIVITLLGLVVVAVVLVPDHGEGDLVDVVGLMTESSHSRELHFLLISTPRVPTF